VFSFQLASFPNCSLYMKRDLCVLEMFVCVYESIDYELIVPAVGNTAMQSCVCHIHIDYLELNFLGALYMIWSSLKTQLS